MSFLHNSKEAPVLIAEIGKNFIDKEETEEPKKLLEKAKKLVSSAKKNGADAVKFQTHVVEDEILKINFKSPHFLSQDRYTWVKRNQLSTPVKEFWEPLAEFCNSIEIKFFSTPMSVLAAKLLCDLNVEVFKIGSGDVTDFSLIEFVCSTKKPIIISTGMVSYRELTQVADYIIEKGNDLTILYCISKYPCNDDDFNLLSIKKLIKDFPKARIGFSDHSVNSNLPAICAHALGAKVFEKHYSFDRNAWGSDHKASLLPAEFLKLSVELKKNKPITDQCSQALLGTYQKELEGANNQFRRYFRKGLVYSRDLKSGDIPKKGDLTSLRPLMASEIDAWYEIDLRSKVLKKDIKKGDIVRAKDFD